MGNRICMGIDVGTLGLKIAVLSLVRERMELKHLCFFPLPGNESDNFSPQSAQSLGRFLHTRKIKIRKAVAGISGPHLNVRYVRVPPVSSERMRDIVAMNVEQFTATAAADLAYGYLPLDLPDDKTQQEKLVAIYVAKSNHLDRLNDFFREAGVKIEGFFPNTHAMYQAFLKFGRIPEKELVCLADIGHSCMNLAVSRESSLYFLRNVNIGVGVIERSVEEDDEDEEDGSPMQTVRDIDLSAGGRAGPDIRQTMTEESPMDRMLFAAHSLPDAIEATFKFARIQTKMAQLAPKRILLTGRGSEQKGLAELIQERMGVPVLPVPWAADSLCCASQELELAMKENSRSHFTALGVAHLASEPAHTLKMVGSRQRLHGLLWGKHLYEYGSLALCALILLVLSILTWGAAWRCAKIRERLQTEHAYLQQRSELLAIENARRQDLEERWTLLARHGRSNLRILELLRWLDRNMPDQMSLAALEYTKNPQGGSRLVLKGVWEEHLQVVYQDLSEFEKTLEKSSGWRLLESRSTPDDEKDPKKLDFTLLLSRDGL